MVPFSKWSGCDGYPGAGLMPALRHKDVGLHFQQRFSGCFYENASYTSHRKGLYSIWAAFCKNQQANKADCSSERLQAVILLALSQANTSFVPGQDVDIGARHCSSKKTICGQACQIDHSTFWQRSSWLWTLTQTDSWKDNHPQMASVLSLDWKRDLPYLLPSVIFSMLTNPWIHMMLHFGTLLFGYCCEKEKWQG